MTRTGIRFAAAAVAALLVLGPPAPACLSW
jgi:hypothetical protein